MLTRLLLVLLSLLLTTGCVAKRKYIDLEAEYTSTKGELLDQINQLEGDVKALKKDLASADSVINSMEGDLRFAKSRIYELEGDKAKLLDDKAGLGAAIEEMERYIIPNQFRPCRRESIWGAFRVFCCTSQ